MLHPYESNAWLGLRRLAFRFLVVVVVLMATGLAAHRLIERELPFSWPDPDTDFKRAQLVGPYKGVTTIAVGSSRIYNGFDPRVFDSTAMSLGKVEKAYNFGVLGMFNPESYYVVSNLIAMKPKLPALKRIVIEITPAKGPRIGRLMSTRMRAWRSTKLSFENESEIWKGQVFSQLNKLKYGGMVAAAFITHLMNFGLTSEAISRFQNGRVLQGLEPFSPAGFWNEKERDQWLKASNQFKKPSIEALKLRNNLLAQQLKPLQAEVLNASNLDKGKPNPVLEKQLKTLTKEANAAGVKLYFVLMPRLSGFEITGTQDVFNKMAKHSKLNCFSLPLNQDVYSIETSLDAHHLNNLGAQIFSAKLARQLFAIEEESGYLSK